jgi:hypothetical protein
VDDGFGGAEGGEAGEQDKGGQEAAEQGHGKTGRFAGRGGRRGTVAQGRLTG